MGTHAISNSTAHKVDGNRGPPGVVSLVVGSPPVGDAFGRGDAIVATVTFNKAVTVTGSPQLALTIGSATCQASYAGGTGTASLVFRYVVVMADADADGLSIGSSALVLNGGTIADARDGVTAAVLSLGSSAIANAGSHKVNGNLVRGPPEPGHPPKFGQDAYAFELAENVAGEVVVGVVSAADPDEGDEVFYELAGGGGGLFDVGEDYETGPAEHALSVAAGLRAAAEVVVTVVDADEAPVFGQDSYAFDLAENAAGPLVLGAVSVTGSDEGDAPSYSLAKGGGGLFEVDASSGAVRYAGAGEDYETGPGEHDLVVAAADKGGLRATATATVVVTDVNEAPQVSERIAIGLLEAHGAAARAALDEHFRDPDGDALSYAAESSDAAVAAASVAGGVLAVQPLAIGTASVTVTATDPDGLEAEQTVEVRVEASRSERRRSARSAGGSASSPRAASGARTSSSAGARWVAKPALRRGRAARVARRGRTPASPASRRRPGTRRKHKRPPVPPVRTTGRAAGARWRAPRRACSACRCRSQAQAARTAAVRSTRRRCCSARRTRAAGANTRVGRSPPKPGQAA